MAPGFNACTDKAESTTDQVECYEKAYEYWDKNLNTNFKAAQKECNEAEGGAEEYRKNLLKAQRAWIQYKEAMAEVIFVQQGTGSLARLATLDFEVTETRKQAELLGQ